MAPQDMRGLTQYIADLRAARVPELEQKRINKEMAHIRQKFKEGNLDGYSKKKYLSKIVFTYILGYQVDIGHMEAVNLISSQKYSEKQIGYLALTLLMHENSDLVRLVVNSIRKDLEEFNDTTNCLALHAIANIGGAEMAETLAVDVHRLLISPTSKPIVKKKAALTLLRLYRKHPDVIPAADWALRIVSIMDDANLGVVIAVTSLVMTLAQDHLEAFHVCYQKAADRLRRIVIEHEYTADYVYYKVPVPWLQVKLFRLLQYYPPTDDPTLQQVLHKVLDKTLRSRESVKNVQHNNAQNAVLFEAINLAIHLDSDATIVSAAAGLLGKYIHARETNVRYLALDAMTHLAVQSESLSAVKRHQDLIIRSLRDRDISVRRRGLDLLYSMCDTSNAKVIVDELLKYLVSADYLLREELVLKIAILTEKFASEYEWYVDTILRLMTLAGDHVGDEVWYRIIQIVVNTEDLQEYSARKVFDILTNPSCHENVVKVGAYILGEYGHLIADEEGRSPIQQFQLLHSRANLCSAATRGLLLTTYFKWINIFPEIREQLLSVFRHYSRVLDSELQQRACEYLAISTRPDEDLLSVIADEMPPYPERESALLSRLIKKTGDSGDKRVWVVGGAKRKQSSASAQALSPTQTNGNGVPSPVNGKEAEPSDDIMTNLAGLDLSSPTLRAETLTEKAQPLVESPTDPLPPAKRSVSPLPPEKTAKTPPPVPTRRADQQLTHGADKWLDKLLYTNEGILFEDAHAQVGVKTEYHGHLGRVALFFGNKMPTPVNSFTLTVDVEEQDSVAVTIPQIPQSTVQPGAQVQVLMHLECKGFFSKPPVVNISFLAGSLQSYRLRLPAFVTKFMEPVNFDSAGFFERWRQIGGPPREAQRIFTIKLEGGQVNTERHRRIVGGSRLAVLDGIDPNASNLVAAGVLHMSSGRKVGCLLRLEPNARAKLCRLTVRSTNEDVTKETLTLLANALSVK